MVQEGGGDVLAFMHNAESHNFLINNVSVDIPVGCEKQFDVLVRLNEKLYSNFKNSVPGTIQRPQPNLYHINFSTGTSISALQHYLIWDIRVALSADYYGQTSGLLGTWDGNIDNDFQLMNGTNIANCTQLTTSQVYPFFITECM